MLCVVVVVLKLVICNSVSLVFENIVGVYYSLPLHNSACLFYCRGKPSNLILLTKPSVFFHLLCTNIQSCTCIYMHVHVLCEFDPEVPSLYCCVC